MAQLKTSNQINTYQQKQMNELLKAILEELWLLRSEIVFLLPQDHLEDYAHPERIKSSYKKALKQYPPLSFYGNHKNK